MSASDWKTCPRCVRRAGAVREQARAAVQETYGKVPSAEFLAALEAVPPAPRVTEQNFREDWEIYGAETGTVHVDYSGNCTECGLHLHFTHEHEIEETGS